VNILKNITGWLILLDDLTLADRFYTDAKQGIGNEFAHFTLAEEKENSGHPDNFTDFARKIN